MTHTIQLPRNGRAGFDGEYSCLLEALPTVVHDEYNTPIAGKVGGAWWVALAQGDDIIAACAVVRGTHGRSAGHGTIQFLIVTEDETAKLPTTIPADVFAALSPNCGNAEWREQIITTRAKNPTQRAALEQYGFVFPTDAPAIETEELVAA